jgi:hypothetical protein
MVPSERAEFVPSARETGVSVVTVRGKAVPPVVPPTVIFPEALTWTLCVPPVEIANVSSAGKAIPVFVSPVFVIDGAAADPSGNDATPVNVGLAAGATPVSVFVAMSIVLFVRVCASVVPTTADEDPRP